MIMEKKRLWIYIAIAYGITALMSIFIFIGMRGEVDTSNLVNAQMMYPACGVILGKLIAKKEGEELPVAGYITILITTALMMITGILSVLISLPMMDMGGAGQMDPWSLIAQLPIIFGSIIVYILFWACGKKKAENAGIRRKNIKTSIIMVAIFLVLYMARYFGSMFIGDHINGNTEGWDSFKALFTNFQFYLTAVSLPINYFMVFLAFFGEEYGWRYYLQPVMQNKFGKRLGVILLGLVWAVWHINIDFMYYTKDTQIQMFLAQIITCVSIGIFFGYAYMKTGNIWVPVIMHYLNNNLIAVLSAGDASVIQNQSVSWIDLPIHLATSIMFILFIIAPIYNKGSKTQVPELETASAAE